jgi:hypothetical protein
VKASMQKDYLNMLNVQEFSDITLIVEGKAIYCHQVVLASRSDIFEKTFSMNFAEKEQREASYPDVPYDLFMVFLKHLYSD